VHVLSLSNTHRSTPQHIPPKQSNQLASTHPHHTKLKKISISVRPLSFNRFLHPTPSSRPNTYLPRSAYNISGLTLRLDLSSSLFHHSFWLEHKRTAQVNRPTNLLSPLSNIILSYPPSHLSPTNRLSSFPLTQNTNPIISLYLRNKLVSPCRQKSNTHPIKTKQLNQQPSALVSFIHSYSFIRNTSLLRPITNTGNQKTPTGE